MITRQTVLGINPGAYGAVAGLAESGDLLDAHEAVDARGERQDWRIDAIPQGVRWHRMKFTVYRQPPAD